MLLEVTWELHGKPLAPKMHPGQKKNIKLDFLPPVRGPFLDHFREKSGKEPFVFSLFFEAVNLNIISSMSAQVLVCFPGTR